jgi:hypothetical protein
MRHLILILVGLIAAAGLGYFVGFDHGFENGASAQARTPESAVTSAAQMMSNIVGMWQSTEDPRFTREIRNDGIAIDAYAGASTTSQGHWMVFTKEIPDTSFTGALEDGATYFSFSIDASEKLYFKILKADADSLDLVYLDRGNTLSFKRVK